MLEEGKVYLLKTTSGRFWLFKKYMVSHICEISSCSNAICLNNMYKSNRVGYVCIPSNIAYIKYANKNYIAMWNRTFNDNVEMV